MMDFVAYSDESYIRAHRYRSISAITFPLSNEPEVLHALKSDLCSSNIEEFKWHELSSAKYRHCAIKFLNTIFENLSKYEIRIDTIIWDTHDRRYDVLLRDDDKNFERMFFHLHHSTLRKRPEKATWKIHPDERMGIDWATIHDCLSFVGQKQKLIKSPLFGDFFTDSHYQISDFQEVDSKQAPCCQLADLFAGIAVFSRTQFIKFWMWHMKKTPGLFEEPELKISNSENERFQVLDHLNCRCKDHKLRVGLKTTRGLLTYNASYPLNFWLYRPQH
jgi:hypothetical protein